MFKLNGTFDLSKEIKILMNGNTGLLFEILSNILNSSSIRSILIVLLI